MRSPTEGGMGMGKNAVPFQYSAFTDHLSKVNTGVLEHPQGSSGLFKKVYMHTFLLVVHNIFLLLCFLGR